MKTKSLTLLFLIITCLLSAQESPVRLKILCYNLRFGELATLEELASFIREQEPDVVALQEVDCRTYRERAPHQHGKDFVTELGFRTGMLTAYGKTIPYAGGYYGIGILSRYPLESVERIYLPKTANGKEQRAILVANVEYSEGRYFTFASTHLDYTNTEERQLQVEKLNEVLHARPYPVIVTGDFNARPYSVEIEEGMKDWNMACKAESTVPANAPRHQIDYIFCYPQNKWKAVDAATIPVQLSDHLPVTATVELREAPPTGLLCNLLSVSELSVITDPQLSFSWIVPQGGQSAYRILVASSRDKALMGEGDIQDTGKTLSTQSINIICGEEVLQADTTYWWTVQIWDADGYVSPFGSPQQINIGNPEEKRAWPGGN